MSAKNKGTSQPSVAINAEAARQIRQHARSALSTEICGVLIGQDRPGSIKIEACIAGANAEGAGAHVTFTQDTWEHIYQIKDKMYPDHRIVGWYHSHPGFGVFLSEHDTFIHRNFFASPGQIAWVFDPQSDEEGCFGWVSGRIERLSQVTIADRRGGEAAQESGCPEPTVATPHSEAREQSLRFAVNTGVEEENSNDSLLRLTMSVFTYLAALLAGFLIAWYLFPRIEVIPVPVDPTTGRPLPGYSLEAPRAQSGSDSAASQDGSPNQSTSPGDSGIKEGHAQSK
jgi:proteasome lid subunit RPN8/RPN11